MKQALTHKYETGSYTYKTGSHTVHTYETGSQTYIKQAHTHTYETGSHTYETGSHKHMKQATLTFHTQLKFHAESCTSVHCYERVCFQCICMNVSCVCEPVSSVSV